MVKLQALADKKSGIQQLKVDGQQYTFVSYDETDESFAIRGASGNTYWVSIFDSSFTARSATYNTYKPGYQCKLIEFSVGGKPITVNGDVIRKGNV
jgi:hypothetical protein